VKFALDQPAALLLLAVVPMLLAVMRYGERRRRASLARFRAVLASAAPDGRKRTRQVLVLLAAMALVLAMSRPVWRPEGPPVPAKRTGDVVFLLDVSRSMLADDVAPNRLALAKRIAAELAAQLRGERIALVTFAGNAALQCPLTLDYAYFRERLDTASMDSVTRGGTRLGDAIGFAAQTAFDDVERGNKSLVLLTDGGDQESSPDAAAAAAWLRGIRLLAIGIGDERAGALVPNSATDRTPLLYRGRPVVSRLDGAALRAIAAANRDGAYLESGLDGAQVYRQWLAARGRRSQGGEGGGTEWYPALLACAIVLLAAEMALGERVAGATRNWSPGSLRAMVAALAVLGAVCGLGFQETPQRTTSGPPAAAPAKRSDVPFEVSDWVAAGDEFFRMKNYTEAARNYAIASDGAIRSPEILFDLATTLYHMQLYGEAATDFAKAAELSRDARFRARCQLGQANCAYRVVRGKDAFELAQAYSAVLAQYRAAWAADPALADAPHNIEVVKRKLQDLREQLRAASSNFMLQSPADLERQKHDRADDILREGQAGNARRSDRRTVDRDW
jgi:Ca-activated chloride channel homolog